MNKACLEEKIFPGELKTIISRMVQTPSLSGDEGKLASYVAQLMKKSGFDNIGIDKVGNAVGCLQGRGGPSILYLAHMDHVPPGEMSEPYSGKSTISTSVNGEDEAIYGRGSVDNKGSLASMIVAVKAITRAGLRPPGDIYVAGVIMEELTGSPGSCHLVETIPKPDLVVVGEPTSLDIALGHRSSAHFDLVTRGLAAHASNPEKGHNALYAMGPILEEVKNLSSRLPEDAILGPSTAAACTISVSPNQRSVIPDICRLAVNIRAVPQLTIESMKKELESILQKGIALHPCVDGEVVLASSPAEAYTGVPVDLTGVMLGFYTDASHPYAQAAYQVCREIVGNGVDFKTWKFATDGGVFDSRGITTIGIGPGDEQLSHTAEENITVRDLVNAAKIYALLPFCLK